ncbi:MAG: hypothetical protein WD063_03900 [Pirellulales bacterium]
MKKTAVSLIALLAVAALTPAFSPPAARAGTIVGTGAIAGPGLGFAVVPAINTFSESNDNQPGGPGSDANIAVPIKRFDHTGNIDIEFFVRSSDPGGTTEYLFFESVDNNTGINWDKYTVVLGFGVGAAFTPSPGGDGLDFDAPTFDSLPTSTAFAVVATAEDALVFSGGIHSSGSEVYQFRIDVPDGRQSFTLRQTPHLVPEPGTLLLSLNALVGVTLFVRCKRCCMTPRPNAIEPVPAREEVIFRNREPELSQTLDAFVAKCRTELAPRRSGCFLASPGGDGSFISPIGTLY